MSLVFKMMPRPLVVETFGIVCVLGDGVSDRMEDVTNGEVLAVGGVEIYFPIFEPPGTTVKGALENIIVVTGATSLTSLA